MTTEETQALVNAFTPILQQMARTMDVLSEAVTELKETKHEQSPVCMMRFNRLEETVSSNQRVIQGSNGDSPGLVGLMQVLTTRIERVEQSHEDLQKTLTSLVVAVVLTLIATIINLVIK